MSDWTVRAKCRGDDVARYVLDEDPHYVHPSERESRASALCAGCPVKRECASAALANDDWGVVRAGLWLEMVRADRPTVRRALGKVATCSPERRGRRSLSLSAQRRG